jgi:tetratricopeptide (TPR) repeat protein
MSEAQLNRWIKRIGLLFLVALVAFVAFYMVDRFRAPTPAIVDQRLTSLEAKVRDDPADIVSRGKLADVYLAKGRYQDAITQYTAIIDAKGNDVELAKYQRAHAYVALNQLDLAIADYQAVVDIAKGGEMANVDPTLEGAYYGLGDIAMRQNRPADAIPLLSSALKIKNSDADALLLIGKAYSATGDADLAGQALRRAVMFVPIGWAEPYQVMADAYTKAGSTELAEWANAMVVFVNGKPDDAVARLTPLVGGKAGLDATIGLGLIAESRGQLDQARDWYRKAVAIDPQNVAATMGLGRVGTNATPAPASPMPSLLQPGSSTGGNG